MKTQNFKSVSQKALALFAMVTLITFSASAQSDTSKMKNKMAHGKMAKAKTPGKIEYGKMSKMSDSKMKKDNSKM